MAHAAEPAVGPWTAADLVERFGAIPLYRIRHDPPPGNGTEQDVVEIHNREKKLYELIDGVLLGKTVGAYESYLAMLLVQLLGAYVRETNMGIVLGPDGTMRLAPGLVRIPDVSLICWDRLPGRKVPHEPIFDLAPDLAVEVISKHNTPREMDRKLADYFAAGVRQVWYVYHTPVPEVHVFAAPDDRTVLSQQETLGGGDLLPGFRLDLGQLFSEPGPASKS